MNKRSSHAQALYLSRTSAARVRLRRSGEGMVLDQVRSAAVSSGADGLPDWLEAARSLGGESPRGECSVCIADELLLYRVIDLPDADAKDLERMVAAQAEAALPGAADRLVWAWTPLSSFDPAQRRVLLCAVRRDLFTRAVDAALALGEPGPVVPSGAAVAALARREAREPQSENPQRASVALLHVAAGHTTALLLHHDRLAACGTIDYGTDDWPRGPLEPDTAALAAWSGDAELLFRELVHTLPSALHPRRCLLASDQSPLPNKVVEAAGRATGIPTAILSMADLRSETPAEDFPPMGAVGAAAARLDKEAPALDLNPRPDVARTATRRGPRLGRAARVAALAVWVLAALLLLYQMDRREADGLEAAVQELRASRDRIGGTPLDRRLGDYLRQTATPPLPLLASTAPHLPRGTLLSAWRYNREDGRVRISGKGRGVESAQELLRELDESDLFTSVQLDSARSTGRREWSFEITARVAPLFRYVALASKLESQWAQQPDRNDGRGLREQRSRDEADDDAESNEEEGAEDEEPDDGGGEDEPSADADRPAPPRERARDRGFSPPPGWRERMRERFRQRRSGGGGGPPNRRSRRGGGD